MSTTGVGPSRCSGPACGSTVVLPPDILQPSTFLVVADVGYTFTPPFGKFITGDIDLTDKFYLRPRYSNSITYATGC